MAQTMRVIGRDLDVDIYDGGAVDGTPSWGGAIAIEGRAREVRVSEEIGEIDTSALGDVAKRFRPDQSEWTLELDLVVETGGLPALTLGNYCKVGVKLYSTFSVATYIGFLKNLEITSRQGDTAIERLTVRGPVDQTIV